MKEFVDGDAIELTFLCSTHSSAFSEGYDYVLWPLFQYLAQALRWGTSKGGIAYAEGWSEKWRQGGTLQRAGEHRSSGLGEELFEDPAVYIGAQEARWHLDIKRSRE